MRQWLKMNSDRCRRAGGRKSFIFHSGLGGAISGFNYATLIFLNVCEIRKYTYNGFHSKAPMFTGPVFTLVAL